MDTRVIECKLIDVPKSISDNRTFQKPFAKLLADSIKVDGLLCPIVVRPNPEAPGRFILVAGKHRLYAVKNILKEQSIESNVLEGMDEEDAKFAGQVENFVRNPLSKAQLALALNRWHERWMAKHSDQPSPVAAMVESIQDSAAKAAADKTAFEPKEEAGAGKTDTVADPKKKEHKHHAEHQFNETAAAATGQTVRSVQTSKRIGSAFTEDQLEVFTQMGVSQTDMTTIAKVEDPAKRAQIVEMIGLGSEPAESVKAVMGEEAPLRDNGSTTKADRETQAAAAKEQGSEMTEEEWFSDICGEKAAMLGKPAKFKADALLFRKLAVNRHTFRTKSKKDVQATKNGTVYGAFTNLVNRLLSIAHPKDWLLCPECKGSGELSIPVTEQQAKAYGPGFGKTPCTKCFGGGYMLKVEEYL